MNGTVHAAADGDWTTPAHDYASTRYSALTEITAANVAQLTLAWSFSTSNDKDKTVNSEAGTLLKTVAKNIFDKDLPGGKK